MVLRRGKADYGKRSRFIETLDVFLERVSDQARNEVVVLGRGVWGEGRGRDSQLSGQRLDYGKRSRFIETLDVFLERFSNKHGTKCSAGEGGSGGRGRKAIGSISSEVGFQKQANS